ncbi:MAG: xylulokinase [Caldilineaceae bacterium]|nr:xylulokinase [Caldilineaceae bacterium]
MAAYLLGIDVSTTATKALLIDSAGKVVAVAATEYGFETPHPLWSEQDPAMWWYAAVQSIRRLLADAEIDPAQISAVGLTGQMHGLTLLDEAGVVLRPAILWNDQRTGAECDEIRTRLGKDQLVQVTGNDALTGFTAPKILWVRNHEPEIFARAKSFLLPKDYLRFRLTGVQATDRADGSGTLLMDLQSRDWSKTVLDALELPNEFVPKSFEGTEITGTISAAAAEATGLCQGTPVVAGGGDQAAGAVGVGAVQEGIVSLALGTSGVVFATVNRPVFEPEGRLHAFCHSVLGRWHLMGVMLAAAGSLRWYRDTIAPGVGYDDLLAPAADLAPGSEGLIFLPYLTGERTPHPDPWARGAFVGLTIRHTLPHMTRAVLEGVAFGLRDSFELMKGVGLAQIRQVRISGGGARSPIWRQILADVLGTELVTVNTTEGAAFGAALLAGVGAGIWPDVDTACATAIHVTGSTTPQAATMRQYEPVYQAYGALYPALKANFAQLSAL